MFKYVVGLFIWAVFVLVCVLGILMAMKGSRMLAAGSTDAWEGMLVGIAVTVAAYWGGEKVLNWWTKGGS